ncbi:MAG: hypothetical protein OQL06_09180 [Gammaproteobacteria bacterium]|nr:hypothetical protein [Gammaproteobacteria bacterium]
MREKISAEKQEEILPLEQRITGIGIEIVLDAMQAGDIATETDVPDGIVFGLWTMGYGSSLHHLSTSRSKN